MNAVRPFFSAKVRDKTLLHPKNSMQGPGYRQGNAGADRSVFVSDHNYSNPWIFPRMEKLNCAITETPASILFLATKAPFFLLGQISEKHVLQPS